MPERYSNTDIMDKLMLISMKQETMGNDLLTVKEQALKTNGRVNTIEQWMNGLLAVDKYKAEHEKTRAPLPVPATSPRWFQNDKLVGGVVAVLLGLAGLIGYVASQIGGH